MFIAQLKKNSLANFSREHFQEFWEKNPALFVGIHLLLGSATALFPHFAFIFPLLFLCAHPRSLLKIVQSLLLITLSFCYFHLRYPTTDLLEKKVTGNGYFSISSVKPSESPFHRKSLLYQGIIPVFDAGSKGKFYHLPCSIFLEENDFVMANADYLIHGELIQKDKYRFILKPEKNREWKKLSGTFSFAHFRFTMKEKIRHFLTKRTSHPKALSFLSALATGDVIERTLNFEFKQTGLLHILAISGFQFVLIAGFFSFFLRFLFPYKILPIILLLILSSYYFFLGPSPSVQRSYIAVLIFFVGQFFNLTSKGLNLLGLGLIVEILFDPLLVANLGFELTFLCTGAILFFYQPAKKLLSLLIPIRKKGEMRKLSLFDQHGYLFASLARGSLAMNLAVHLISLPVLLFLFHKFSYLSLCYNLFFPFLSTLMLFLLILTLLFFPVLPFIGNFLHQMNCALTSSSLELVSNPPALFNYYLRVPEFPFTLLMIILTTFLSLGIALQGYDSSHT